MINFEARVFGDSRSYTKPTEMRLSWRQWIDFLTKIFAAQDSISGEVKVF